MIKTQTVIDSMHHLASTATFESAIAFIAAVTLLFSFGELSEQIYGDRS